MTRFGLAINTGRCIGCHTCANACKMQNNVPMGMLWNRVLTEGCDIVDGAVGQYPNVSRAYLPVACQHCENPACLRVCPTGAIGPFDPDVDKMGVAVVQKDRCVAYYQGCVECQKACPYEAIALDETGHPVVDAAACNGCGVCENVCPALVYRSFAGGTRRGIVVVSPARYERLGTTVANDESEMMA